MCTPYPPKRAPGFYERQIRARALAGAIGAALGVILCVALGVCLILTTPGLLN